MTAENSQIPLTPLTPEELALRRKQVRKVVLLRGTLLGSIVAAWWIFFAPEGVVDSSLKNSLGIAAGLIATGAYFYMLRQSLFPEK